MDENVEGPLLAAQSGRSYKPISAKERPRGENVVDLPAEKAPKNSAKKPRKAASGQKEMLMRIEGKKPGRETAAKKSAARQRKSA